MALSSVNRLQRLADLLLLDLCRAWLYVSVGMAACIKRHKCMYQKAQMHVSESMAACIRKHGCMCQKAWLHVSESMAACIREPGCMSQKPGSLPYLVGIQAPPPDAVVQRRPHRRLPSTVSMVVSGQGMPAILQLTCTPAKRRQPCSEDINIKKLLRYASSEVKRGTHTGAGSSSYCTQISAKYFLKAAELEEPIEVAVLPAQVKDPKNHGLGDITYCTWPLAQSRRSSPGPISTMSKAPSGMKVPHAMIKLPPGVLPSTSGISPDGSLAASTRACLESYRQKAKCPSKRPNISKPSSA
jgi:hypothetical protein